MGGGDLFKKAKSAVVLNISCIPAGKLLPDQTNHHSSLFTPETWITLINSVAERQGKIFALFLTVEKNKSVLAHNIPYELHDYAFQDYSLYPFQDENGPAKFWVQFYNNKNQSLEKVIPSDRWMKSHIHFLYRRELSFVPEKDNSGMLKVEFASS